MKIAFSSIDGQLVNQHFGWSEAFYIYELDVEKFSFLQKADASQQKENEIDKLEYKIACLGEVDIVYVSQIGPKAANMVQSAGIFPMRSSSEGEKIDDVIKKMQNMIRENPPLWIQRILAKGTV